MIYYYEADGNGTDSIADVLGDKKKITHIPISTYEEFDKHVASIVMKVTPNDTVILDTLNALANTTRGDSKLGTDPTENLWLKRDKIIADKNYMTVYTLASQLILRRLKNLSRAGEGAKIIVTCHEAERFDESTIPPTKKRAPDVNPELLGSLVGSSSDVFRLTRLDEHIVDEDGNEILPADTRILQVKGTEEYLAKYHVPRSRVPSLRNLADPTYHSLCEMLGKTPTWLTVYGAPGVGKSTFATSMLR